MLEKLFFLTLFSISLLYSDMTLTTLPGDISDVNSSSKAWISTTFNDVKLYSKDDTNATFKNIKIKVISDKKHIAVLSTIPSSPDKNSSKRERLFFIQFSKKNNTLPYIDGGDINNPVIRVGIDRISENIKKRCDENCSDKNSTTVFKSLETVSLKKESYFGYIFNGLKKERLNERNTTMHIDGNANKLYAIKNIDSNQSKFLISFGYETKDDNKSKKFLSKWIRLSLNSDSQNKTQITNSNTDIKKGKDIFIQNCIACHRYNSDTTAPKGIAPMLTNIGGYGNENFIKESITDPNAIINPYFLQKIKEKKISPMPSFDWLSPKELDNLVAFLKELKAKKSSVSKIEPDNSINNMLDSNITF